MVESTRVVLEIPPSLADELATASQSMLTDLLQRGLRNLRIDQALENYRQGNYSFGAAAELAGISQSDLAQEAYARGMEPPFDERILVEVLGEQPT
jgi:predicted HTH domain antitoxin